MLRVPDCSGARVARSKLPRDQKKKLESPQARNMLPWLKFAFLSAVLRFETSFQPSASLGRRTALRSAPSTTLGGWPGQLSTTHVLQIQTFVCFSGKRTLSRSKKPQQRRNIEKPAGDIAKECGFFLCWTIPRPLDTIFVTARTSRWFHMNFHLLCVMSTCWLKE